MVAQEVRELASRSANAAKDIKALIEASSNQVQGGVVQVNRTGQALLEIGGQIAQVNTMIDDILTAAKEQSIGITEINAAVNDMDRATQQNAAMAEETSAACRNLTIDAKDLEAVVSQFEIESAGRPTPSSRTSASVSVEKLTQSGAMVANAGASPAKALRQKIARAFSAGGTTATAVKENNWEEF